MVMAPGHRGEAHPCPPGEAQGETKMQAAIPGTARLFGHPLGGWIPSEVSFTASSTCCRCSLTHAKSVYDLSLLSTYPALSPTHTLVSISTKTITC